MDNSRDLDMEGIIKSVECCYEEIAQKSKAEVEAFYQTRVSIHTTGTDGNEIPWPTEPRGPFLSSMNQLKPTPWCACTLVCSRESCQKKQKIPNHLKTCFTNSPSKQNLADHDAAPERSPLCTPARNTIPFPKGKCSGPTWGCCLVQAEVTSGCFPGAPALVQLRSIPTFPGRGDSGA